MSKFHGFKWIHHSEQGQRDYLKEVIKSKCIEDENGCWVWQSYKNKWGYGTIDIGPLNDRKKVNAHRAAWWAFTGNELLKNIFICHTCDNRSCCNPEHLFEGSPKDNMHDMINKGRSKFLKGDECPWSTLLNEKLVIEILEKITRGKSLADLSKEYGIPRKYLSEVKRGRRWGHIGDRSRIPKIKANGIRLKKDQVIEIKKRFKNGERIRNISKEYGIHETTIADIKHKRTWKWLDNE
jgi:uncharacterized protein YerC